MSLLSVLIRWFTSMTSEAEIAYGGALLGGSPQLPIEWVRFPWTTQNWLWSGSRTTERDKHYTPWLDLLFSGWWPTLQEERGKVLISRVKVNSVSLLSPFPYEHKKHWGNKCSPGIQRPLSSSAKESLTSLTNEEIPTDIFIALLSSYLLHQEEKRSVNFHVRTTLASLATVMGWLQTSEHGQDQRKHSGSLGRLYGTSNTKNLYFIC